MTKLKNSIAFQLKASTLIRILLILSISMFSISTYAQSPASYLQMAKEEIDHQRLDAALEITKKGLAEFDNDFDLMALKARLWLWQSKYDSAEQTITQLETSHPDNAEVLNLRLKYHEWQAQWSALENYSRKQLGKKPGALWEESLVLSLVQQGKYKEALDFGSTIEPQGKVDLLLQQAKLRHYMALGLTERFSYFRYGRLRHWHGTALTLESHRQTPWLASLLYVDRFDQSGLQLGFQTYPRLSPKTTANLAVAWSPDDILPAWKISGGIDHSISSFILGLEGGMNRHTYETVYHLIPALSYYFGHYSIQYQAIVNQLAGVRSYQGKINLRRYLKTSKDFMELSYSDGNYVSMISAGHIDFIDTRGVSLKYQRLMKNWLFNLSGEYLHEAIPELGHRTRFSFRAGISKLL